MHRVEAGRDDQVRAERYRGVVANAQTEIGTV